MLTLFQKSKRVLELYRNRGVNGIINKLIYILPKILDNVIDAVAGPAILRPMVLSNLRNHNGKIDTPEKAVDFVFSQPLKCIEPIQFKTEIIGLLDHINKEKPKCILEIGTAKGGSLFLFTTIASSDATVISVDLPGKNLYGGGGGYYNWRTHLYKSFRRGNQSIYLLRQDTHENETLTKIKRILNGVKIDFLFIDGDHTYEGVKKDFEMYSSIVRKGGIVAFHDIVEFPPDNPCSVDILWNELKKKYDHREFIADKMQSWGGIGIIIVE